MVYHHLGALRICFHIAGQKKVNTVLPKCFYLMVYVDTNRISILGLKNEIVLMRNYQSRLEWGMFLVVSKTFINPKAND